ncbi:hypothetical protein C5B96_06295 [Subtercola sp. Z020]|uniref:hypothetical protein n=1 Tax=Subtercola sp. Z020 TaxID=2080582 RepID=UPI000CE87C2D|nr:hypothetical protein [Subtercola sp. Z020]PPF85669.1 hypothetical protein C5B96_06295 [Subtercola sp. Z020]
MALLLLAVAVVAMVALWAPMFGASPIVALEGGAEVDTGSSVAVGVPTAAPAAEDVGPVARDAAPAATAVQLAAARTFAGSQLAGNTALTLSATARELLVMGRVDARGILSLGQYLGQTQLTVADFPAVETGIGAGEARRQILLTGLAGVPLGIGEAAPGGRSADTMAPDAAAASVGVWFESLSAPVNVESVIRTPAGVLVTFAPGEPPLMLPSPPPSL